MRAIIQRVQKASVTVEQQIVGEIGQGLLVLLGVGHSDSPDEARSLAEKIAQMRIFADADGKFDRSLIDVGGSVLVVSQFTLYADTRRGRRPSFTDAARPEQAEPLVRDFCEALRGMGLPTATGQFGAHMDVALINDGPVTIMLDTDSLREPRRSGVQE
ncbi:D-tyrosyl-tRNA(Tyr) deacylase [Chloroflexia bacterium SDU3-3]|nr:D-tyrosyl-tRNA(Tyr) deacylase [Chloroflexia bacterium SDU3-3]